MSKLTKIIFGLGIFALIPITLLLSPKPTQAFEQHLNSLVYELVSKSKGVNATDNVDYFVQQGETVELRLTVRNRSRNYRALMWYGKSDLPVEGPSYPNAHCIGVGTVGPRDHQPSWIDPSSFVINGNRFTYYDGEPIYKGKLLVIKFNVKISNDAQAGLYALPWGLVREFDEWGKLVDANGRNYSGDIAWRFAVSCNSQDTYRRGTFNNTKEGYSLSYYPCMVDKTHTPYGAGMINSNSFAINDPGIATDLYLSGELWIPKFQINISYQQLGSDDIQTYAQHFWELNKNDTNPYVHKVVSDFTETTIAGQSTYQFELEGSFKSDGGGWVVNSRQIYTFFRARSGKVLMVEYTANNPTAAEIVNSIRV